MNTDWIAELEKLKTQPIKKPTIQKQRSSRKTELKKLMKLLKAQLTPVVKVFREEGKTKTQQPHIHEYNKGYALVLPVSEEDIEPFILRIQFEFYLTEKGYAMKVNGETEKPIPPPERIIEPPITEEKIRDEIRDFLKKRQLTLLKLRKRRVI